MEESKIKIRYGCDKCGRYFEDKNRLTLVEVKFLRKDDNHRDSIAFTTRKELLCGTCFGMGPAWSSTND